MSQTIWVGAVAYDPKVVAIWEGMRRYFREEARLPLEIVLFQSYEAQVLALLGGPNHEPPRIDIGWNTNLAYLQCEEWSGHRCRPVAMRDTDLGWTTKIVAVRKGPIAALADLKNRTLALGSRDSGHAAILPIHFLEQQGLSEGRDYRTLRFNTDLGKHGDTGTSEVEVVRAVLDGRADAGAVGDPFWKAVQSQHLVPEGALEEVWTSPPYHHCMFTARPGLDQVLDRRFAEALSAMSYDNPAHRAVLEAEGLQRWIPPHTDGYEALREAARRQGFLPSIAGTNGRGVKTQVMRTIRIAVFLSAFCAGAPGSPLTALERQRLIAHMEMTASWLSDEVAGLSQPQLHFRRLPGTWSILELLNHLVVAGPIYWLDLQKAMKASPVTGKSAMSDAQILWYGIDRTQREKAVAPEAPTPQLRDVRSGLDTLRRLHTDILRYVRTTDDDLRGHVVERQQCDAYQWLLLISAHQQRHILQIRELKSDAKFPQK